MKRDSFSRRQSIGLLVGGIVYLGWASTWSVGKLAMAVWTPIGLTTVRHLIAGLLLFIIAAQFGAKPKIPSLSEIIVGFFQCGLYFIFIYHALEIGSVSVAAVVAGMYPVLILLIVPRVERSLVTQIASLAFLLAGISVLVFDQSTDIMNINAPVLGWASAAAMAMTVATLAPRPNQSDSFAEVVRFMATAMLCGGATTGLFGIFLNDIWVRDIPTWENIYPIIWLSLVGSAAVFVGMEWLLRHYGSRYLSMGYATVPGLSVLINIVIYNEHISWRTAIGLGLTLCAFCIVGLSSYTYSTITSPLSLN